MTAQFAEGLERAHRAVTAAVAPEADSAVLRFLRTPMAWVLIAGILVAGGVEGYLRHGNFVACATANELVDHQPFRNPITGVGRGMPDYEPQGGMMRVIWFCQDLSLPSSFHHY